MPSARIEILFPGEDITEPATIKMHETKDDGEVVSAWATLPPQFDFILTGVFAAIADSGILLPLAVVEADPPAPKEHTTFTAR